MGSEVVVSISVRKIALGLIFIAVLGNIMIWFEHDQVKAEYGADASVFFALLVSVIAFALCSVRNFFIPTCYSATIRMFATMLMFFNVDLAICAADTYMRMDESGNLTMDTVRVMRTASIFVLIAAFASFVLAFCFPHSGVSSLLSFRGITVTIASLFFLVGQILVWTIYKNCTLSVVGSYVRNGSPLMIVLIMFFSQLFGDKHGQDLALFLVIPYMFIAAPLFYEVDPQSNPNYSGTWRAEIAFFFTGTIIYLAGVLYEAYRKRLSTQNLEAIFKKRIRQSFFWSQVFMLAVGIAGSVCVFVRSEKDATTEQTKYVGSIANWHAAFGLIIPMLNLWAALADFTAPHILSVVIAPIVASYEAPFLFNGQRIAYYRGGTLLILLVSIFSPIVHYLQDFPRFRIDEYFGDALKDAGPTAATGQRSSPIMFFLFLSLTSAFAFEEQTTASPPWAASSTIWAWLFIMSMVYIFGLINKDADAQRVIYLWFLQLLCAYEVWPVSFFSQRNFPIVMVLISAIWYITVYSWKSPNAIFELLHGESVQEFSCTYQFIRHAEQDPVEPQQRRHNSKEPLAPSQASGYGSTTLPGEASTKNDLQQPLVVSGGAQKESHDV